MFPVNVVFEAGQFSAAVERRDAVTIAHLRGSLILSANGEDLAFNRMMRTLVAASTARLILDMTHLRRVDSCGITCLLAASTATRDVLGGEMVLVHVAE